jgi:hypothetical protein
VAGLARSGGDLADASIELTIAAAGHVLVGEAPKGALLANEALALGRQVGAPALIATALLAVGIAVASTDPEQARGCLRESRELSAPLGYQRALDQLWAAVIAFLVDDRTATLRLGRRAIHTFGWSGDRLRMGIILHLIRGCARRHPVRCCRDHPRRSRSLRGSGAAVRPGSQLHNRASPRRCAHVGTPSPRC